MTQAERDKLLIRLDQAINGNGVEGLGQRMTDTESWQKDHENDHRVFLADQHTYRLQREQKETDLERAKRIRTWVFVSSIMILAIGVLLDLAFRRGIV